MRSAQEFRQAWRGRRLRTLYTPLAVTASALSGVPDSEAVGISVVPSGFDEELFYPLKGRCPMCGEEAEPELRRAICVHLRFRNLDALCIPAWAHTRCIEGCAETEVDAGVPW